MTRCRQLMGVLAVTLSLQGCLFTSEIVEPVQSTMLPDSPSHFFALMESAYESRSVSRLDSLLAPDYQFAADAASLDNPAENTWGRDQELDRHRRMFRAISNVQIKIQFDPTPKFANAERESTWTVWSMHMEMDYDGTPYVVEGRAEFQLRATPMNNGTQRYTVVRWADLN